MNNQFKKITAILLLAALLFLQGCKAKEVVVAGSDTIDYVYASGNDVSGQTNGESDSSTENGTSDSSTKNGVSGSSKSNGGTGSNGNGGSANNNSGNQSSAANVSGGDKTTVTGLENIKGKTIIYAAINENLFVDNSDTKSENSKTLKLLKDVQKKYGFTLQYKKAPATEAAKDLTTAVQAGTKYADFLQCTFHQLNPLILNKAIRNVNEFPEFEVNNPELYSQSYLEQTRVYEKNLFLNPTFGLPAVQYLYFNKTLLKQCGTDAEALYQLVRDGKWTMQKMQQLSNKAYKNLGGGGRSFQDQYGFCGIDFVGAVSSSIYLSAGGSSAIKNSMDGSYKYNFGSTESVSALKAMQNWLVRDSSIYNITDSNENHQKLFEQGRALFFAADNNFDPYKKNSVEWGIVPFPAKSEKEAYRMLITWNSFAFVIPSNNSRDDIALTGYLLKELIPQFGTIYREERKAVEDKNKNYDPAIIEMKSKYIDPNGFLDLMFWGGPTGAQTAIHRIISSNADPAQEVKTNGADYLNKTNAFNKAIKDAK